MSDSIDQFFSEWSSQVTTLPDITKEMQYIYRIAKISRILGERLDQTCNLFGITRSQFEAMAVLRRLHPKALNAQEIMQASMLTSGSVTAMINQLLNAGLVKRKADPEDARRIQITLTTKGIRIIEAALKDRINDNKKLANLLTMDDRQKMNDLMRDLLTKLEKSEQQL
ncbi:MAG: MarR family transcriptional regulator [Kordiimonadaceae bacterium]|nr:MarR family transcriptional regulator [Kordiimonadaceae bacterium]